MRRALKIILPVLVISSGFYLAFWLVTNQKVAESKEPEPFKPHVKVMVVEMDDYQPIIHSQGTIIPRMAIELSTEVSGRVVSMAPLFVEGGLFNEGDELLRIDTNDYELALRQTRARIDTARADITNALAQISSARSQIAQAEARILLEEAEASAALAEWRLSGRVGNPSALLARKPQLKEVQAALSSAKALLTAATAKRQSGEAELVAAVANNELASTNVSRCIVRAPFDGRVSSRTVGKGQIVSSMSTLAQLQSVDVAEIRLALPLSEFDFLELNNELHGETSSPKGPAVRLWSSHGSDSEWLGQVVRSMGEIDKRTRMMSLVAMVEDPYQRAIGAKGPVLSFGMFVTAKIEGRSLKNVTMLPRAALREGETVHVLDGNKLYARKVRVARSTREVVVIDEGLQAGDQICLTAVEAFTKGMEVIVMGDTNGE